MEMTSVGGRPGTPTGSASQAAAEAIVTDLAIIRQGHFLLGSGMHTPYYLEMEAILQDPQRTAVVAAALAERFRDKRPQAVMTAAGLDVLLAYELARQLGARTVFAEGEPGRRSLRRGFQVGNEERVLIAKSVIVSGTAARELIRLATAQGGRAVGVAVLVDRSSVQLSVGAPVEALAVMHLEIHHSPTCPLCAQGVPLERPVD